MIEAILWKHRTGAPWRDLPGEFGSWNSVFSRFNRWSKAGLWQTILEVLRIEADTSGDPDSRDSGPCCIRQSFSAIPLDDGQPDKRTEGHVRMADPMFHRPGRGAGDPFGPCRLSKGFRAPMGHRQPIGRQAPTHVSCSMTAFPGPAREGATGWTALLSCFTQGHFWGVFWPLSGSDHPREPPRRKPPKPLISGAFCWWLDADSNRRPRDYETLALTT